MLLRGLAIACLVMPVAGGCGVSVVGHWRLEKAIPNKEIFAIDDAHFSRDGSYRAVVTIEGKTANEEGQYKFNAFKLTLRPQGGGQHRWNAVERLGKLEVLDGERKAILRKVKKSKPAEESEHQ